MEIVLIILVLALAVLTVSCLFLDSTDKLFGIRTDLLGVFASISLLLMVVFVKEIQLESLRQQTIVYVCCIILLVLSVYNLSLRLKR